MTTGTHPYRFAALTSLALVLPFAILQIRSGSGSRGGMLGAALLFGILWFLPTVSIGSSLSMLRRPAGIGLSPRTRLLLSAVLVLGAAVIWGSLLAGHVPCVIGLASCD